MESTVETSVSVAPSDWLEGIWGHGLSPPPLATVPSHESFPKIPRLSRAIVITEKLDGTNAQIYISDGGEFYVGSRNRWLTTDNDNYGFAKWAFENKQELLRLGPGRHYGEWWGRGIQRGYGVDKRFSMFNLSRWLGNPDLPACVSLVPKLYEGPFDTGAIHWVMGQLEHFGSVAAPGFLKPEGVVIFHKQSNVLFKKTLENDEKGKEQTA